MYVSTCTLKAVKFSKPLRLLHANLYIVLSKPLIQKLLMKIIEAVVCGGWGCGVLMCLCVSSFKFFILCTVVLYTSDCSCICMMQCTQWNYH